MMEYGPETIVIAIIVSSVGFIIIAIILILMFINIRRLGNQQRVDNSLQNELSKSKEDNELKDKTIKNLNDQNSILMDQNETVADQRNEFALLLNQEINKSK